MPAVEVETISMKAVAVAPPVSVAKRRVMASLIVYGLLRAGVIVVWAVEEVARRSLLLAVVACLMI